jgi:hypothetical protein
MFTRLFSHLLPALFLTTLCFPQSRPNPRLHNRIDDREISVLPGNTRPAIQRGLLRDEGRLRSGQKMPRMSLHFTLTPTQSADLTQLLAAQQDRRSPQYHKFLTPEQYAARFGLNPADLAQISAWLEQSGFSDLKVARGGGWISFSGSAAQAESAFHVSLHQYALNGETHFANTADPQLPKALAGLVSSVRGLHNFALHSNAVQIHPQYTSSASGANFMAPDDWATIYDLQPLYSAGLDGSGVTIAIAGQSDIALSDLEAFRSAAGLPAKDPVIVIPPGVTDPGIHSGDEGESDLDLEWSGGIARNANILFVTASPTAGNGVYDSIAYVVDNNAAPILSISYGLCEADESTGLLTSQDAVFQQAAAQGITVLASSGDGGATTCDARLSESQATLGLAVSYPASSQYVTAVGGSELRSDLGSFWNATNNSYGGSARSYIPERVWNDGFQSAGGGGASNVFPKPSWQTGPGVPADSARDLPDISFAASASYNGYLVCGPGFCTNGFRNSSNYLNVFGGTSASAPSFAGLLALIIQKGGGNRLGNINTNLYSLAQISPNAFHDITVGNNQQVCQTGTPNCPNGGSIGYVSGPGYDQATGWGSVDGYNFAQEWFGDFSLTPSVTSLTIQPGTSATPTVSVVPFNNFSGQVTFTCSVAGTLIDVTCSVPSSAVSGNGGNIAVTITAAATAKTPWWNRLPKLPPPSRNWLVTFAALLLIGASFYSFRKPSIHAVAFLSLIVIAIGGVSCGGAGGTTFSSEPAAPPPAALAITCNLPAPTEGSAYSGSCSATGGTAPYTYSVASGTLPAGLTLNPASGAVTGTPTMDSPASATFKVSDSGTPQQSATSALQNFAVAAPALTLTCQLPQAYSGVAYSGSCTGSGGIAPLQYGIIASYPGEDLVLNSSTGAITGTPQLTGVANFVITVTDSSSPTRQVTSFPVTNFVVAPGPLVLSCNLSGGTTGVYYISTCHTVGGTFPVAISISAGSLPAGLNFESGEFFGIPVLGGTSSFTVKAIDGGSPPQVAQSNQSITIATAALTLSCSLSQPKVGAQYFSNCQVGGGTAPFKYSIASGTLPAGLTLSSSTGLIAGVPSAAGSSSFTLQVTDSSSPAQTVQAVAAFTVLATTPLTLTCPAQTANFAAAFAGVCQISGGNTPYTASVTGGALPAGLFAYASGSTVQIRGIPTALGTSTATITVTDSSVPVQTTTAQTTITVNPRPSETGLVTITATSGGITNTTTIQVTVP